MNPDVKANYLASPPLVVAYALAGTTDIDLTSEPIGTDVDGSPVTLQEIWPSQQEIAELEATIGAEMFAGQLRQRLRRQPDVERDPGPGRRPVRLRDGRRPTSRSRRSSRASRSSRRRSRTSWARACWLMLGDSVTTDHISPAGDIALASPGRTLPGGERRREEGLQLLRRAPRQRPRDGARHVRQHPAEEPDGAGRRGRRDDPRSRAASGWTIFDAAERYRAEGTPLVVLAGKEYGSGSSRDWAAKGTLLLGVRAVIAESYERIHRSNLVGMGVLPLQFEARRERRVARSQRPRGVHDPRPRRRPRSRARTSRSRSRRPTGPGHRWS